MQRLASTATCLLSLTLLAARAAFCLGTPAGTVINLAADLTCQDDGSQVMAQTSVRVDQVPGFALQVGAAPDSVTPGAACFVPFTLTNTGNGADSCLLAAAAPAGWDVAVLADTNSDGIHQSDEQAVLTSTGVVQADTGLRGFLAVTPAADAVGTGTVGLTARSALAPTQVASQVASTIWLADQPVSANVAFNPGWIQAQTGRVFETPPVILIDFSLPQTVVVRIGIPDCISLDTTTQGRNLACVTKGDAVSSMTSTWDANRREIVVTAVLPNPYVCAEIVKSIALTASPAANGRALTLNGAAGLVLSTYTVVTPGDFDSNGVVDGADVDGADVDLFRSVWTRWHWQSTPLFSPSADGAYDLAPHTFAAPWPNWTPMGDRVIDINDAVAFVECAVGSQATWPMYNSGLTYDRSGNRIDVFISDAPYGMFQADIPLPWGSVLSPATNAIGNLISAMPQSGAGALYFSEYNRYTNTVRIAGNVVGRPPYHVCQIFLYR